MIADILETLPNGGPRIVELGKIKIGGLGNTIQTRAGNTMRLPRKDDCFTITTNRRDTAGDLIPDAQVMEALKEQYADDDGKLRRIPIFLLSNEPEDVLQAAWAWYGGKTCGARGDGKTITWFCDPKSGQRLKEPKEEPFDKAMLDWTDSRGNKLLKLHAVFNCVIGVKEARWGGVYRFRTTSVISFQQLHGSLVHLSQLTGGVLQAIPLMLVVRGIQVAPDGKPTTVHVVHVELRGSDLAAIQNQALERAKYMLTFHQQMSSTLTQYRRLLVAPGQESDDEAGHIQEEFAPELHEPVTATGYKLLEDHADPQTDSPDRPSQPIRPNEPPPSTGSPVTVVAPEMPPVSEQAAGAPDGVDLVAEAIEQGPEAFEKTVIEAAKKADPSVKRSDISGGLFKWKCFHKQNPTKDAWRELYEAVTENRFDFKSGRLLVAS